MSYSQQETKISDQVWEKIQPLTIGNKGTRGGNADDTRMFIEAVIWVFKTKSPWRLLPKRFGSWNTVQRRFSRWRERGIWEKVLETLIQHKEFEWLFYDCEQNEVYKSCWLRMVCRSETLLNQIQNNYKGRN